jgi:uncharacterized protein
MLAPLRTGSVALALAVVVVTVLAGPGAASHLKEYPHKHRILYQLDDAGVDKAKFVLGNIRNHVNGVGWQNIEAIELVVFGPALKSFVVKTMDPDLKYLLESLQTQGLVFGACGNTMKNFSITLQELPDGSRPLPQGGVVRIMELEDAGYRYIRP